MEASIDLEEGFGSRLDVSADQRITNGPDEQVWQLYFEGRSLSLARLVEPGAGRFRTRCQRFGRLEPVGRAVKNGVEKASANLAVDSLSIEGADRGAPFDVEGRFEFSNSDDGVLFAAENFRLRTVDGEWPRSSIHVQVDTGPDARFDAVNADASFLRLDDIAYFSPWLPQAAREVYQDFVRPAPSANSKLTCRAWVPTIGNLT